MKGEAHGPAARGTTWPQETCSDHWPALPKTGVRPPSPGLISVCPRTARGEFKVTSVTTDNPQGTLPTGSGQDTGGGGREEGKEGKKEKGGLDS